MTTRVDARTLGRVDLLLVDADYADARASLDDAWRLAVLASDPALRADHDRTRAAAVQSANRFRDLAARRIPTSTPLHRGLLVLALVLGAVSLGLIAVSRTGGQMIPLAQGVAIAGACAAAAAALLWWLEPRRANGSLWGSRVPAVIHLFFGVLWLLFAAGVVVLRWGDVDPRNPAPMAFGLAMMTGAGIATLVLWRRALRADRSGRQTGIARLLAGLDDDTDAGLVFAALDRWWARSGPQTVAHDEDRVRAVRAEVLDRLRRAHLITADDERDALFAPPPARWRERRR